MGRRKFLCLGLCGDAFKNFRRIEFRDGTAGFANQKCSGLALMGVGASHECIAAFNLVDKAVGEEKVQGPVNRDGCGPRAMLSHALDNVIGADGGMALGHRCQNITPLAGQFAAAPRAGAFGPGDQVGGAMGMVVVGVKKGHTVII